MYRFLVLFVFFTMSANGQQNSDLIKSLKGFPENSEMRTGIPEELKRINKYSVVEFNSWMLNEQNRVKFCYYIGNIIIGIQKQCREESLYSNKNNKKTNQSYEIYEAIYEAYVK